MAESTLKVVSIETLLRHDDTRLWRAAAKLTHIGEQTIPVGTIVIQAYCYLPSLDVFRVLRSPGVSYHNDELPLILNFSVSPDEFRRIVAEASRVWAAAGAIRKQPSLSFAVVVDAPEGREGCEILFARGEGVALHQALRGALDPTNGMGSTVLAIQRRAAYTNA
jgi:hypothetical protein